jgi:hypothetical protein
MDTGVSVLPPTMGGLKKSKEEEELDAHMRKFEEQYAGKPVVQTEKKEEMDAYMAKLEQKHAGRPAPQTHKREEKPTYSGGGEADLLDDFLDSF